MDFKGVIIEESLENKQVLKKTKITETEVEAVTEKHKTPWIKQWTLHTAEIKKTMCHHTLKCVVCDRHLFLG